MPQTTLKRKSTQSLRRNAKRREKSSGKRCQARSGPKTTNTSVIADSIFGLKLVAKPGIAIIARMKGSRFAQGPEEDYERMYRDLLACLHNAMNILLTPSSFDPLASGLDLSVSIYYVMNAFKSNVLPAKYDVNIDFDDNKGYYFTIFKECDFGSYWHTFEVKPIVSRLIGNSKLEKIFLEVIRCLMLRADICAWWNGGLGYSEYMLDEEIEDWDNRQEYDSDEESMREYQKAVACQKSYEDGIVKDFQLKISNAKIKKPSTLLNELNKFHPNNKIVKWLKEACEFLSLPGTISDFIYPENEDMEGLKYDQQVVIIWDVDDHYSSIQLECLDSEAQTCGINQPVIYFEVTRDITTLNFQNLEERSEWPMKLSQLCEAHHDLLISFKRKKK